jgi:hypothetical protein
MQVLPTTREIVSAVSFSFSASIDGQDSDATFIWVFVMVTEPQTTATTF